MFNINLFFIIFAIIAAAIVIYYLVGMWKIYSKAGKPGWTALIPIYSTYLMSYITFGNINYFIANIVTWVLYLIMEFFKIGSLGPLIEIVSWSLYFLNNLKLSKAFGKSISFAIGLTLLPPIFIPILGFGSAEYIGPQKLRNT